MQAVGSSLLEGVVRLEPVVLEAVAAVVVAADSHSRLEVSRH